MTDDPVDSEERRQRTAAALRRIPRLVDTKLLLSDRAWREPAPRRAARYALPWRRRR